jgi:hypothetical protein
MSSPHVDNQQNITFQVSQMQPPVHMQITVTWIRELKHQQDITMVPNQFNTTVSSQMNGQVAQRKWRLNESN